MWVRVGLHGGLDVMYQHERRGCHVATAHSLGGGKWAMEGALRAQPGLMFDLETRSFLTLNDLRGFYTPET